MRRNHFNRDDRLFNAVNTTAIVILLILFIYPIYFTIIASVSDPFAVVSGRVTVRPIGLTLEAYKNVFKNDNIWIGYRNTTLYTLFGTLLSLLMTIPGAYVLSKKKLPGRSLLMWFCLIPMYFGGGLVPTFLNVKQLGLFNKPYTLIILGSLSVFNVIVTRVFFETSIPGELYESARIDGASEMRTFFAIALPLAAPIIAVMALFYGVGKWNDYFTALLYLSNKDYQPLQLVLRGILIQNQSALTTIDIKDMEADAIEAAAKMAYMAEAMKYALIFIASAPLLAAYPFVQKYFVKGVMIGSLKG